MTLSQDVNQGAGRGAATQMGLHADGAAAPRCAFCVSAHTCVWRGGRGSVMTSVSFSDYQYQHLQVVGANPDIFMAISIHGIHGAHGVCDRGQIEAQPNFIVRLLCSF